MRGRVRCPILESSGSKAYETQVLTNVSKGFSAYLRGKYIIEDQ